MKLKEILSLVCGLNGELCKKGDYLLVETLGRVKTREEDERVAQWCNLVAKHGDQEIVDIVPLEFLSLRITIK